jgi:methyl-accepting chemotaxis protein
LVAAPQEREAYQAISNSQIAAEAISLRNTALAKNEAGNFDIDPETWWKAQTLKMDALNQTGNKQITNAIAYIDNKIGKAKKLFYFLVFLLFAVFAAIFISTIYVLRSLVRKLEEEIALLSATGSEISNSITQASNGTAETAAAVAETTTTVEELKQTSQISSEKAKGVSDLSEDALNILHASERSIAETVEGMNRIQTGMQTISDSIARLSEHSMAIGVIIDSVNDIAEQSHLLAVNAAIEAAKAGEQGKGFAVVAQEVRNLADQSKQATVQVRNLLNDIQNATGAAVMATEQGSKTVMNGIAQSSQMTQSIQSLTVGVNKVVQSASQISMSSHQQFVGIDQVTVAMNNIKEASNQQVDHLRVIEKKIHALRQVGQSLQNLVLESKI